MSIAAICRNKDHDFQFMNALQHLLRGTNLRRSLRVYAQQTQARGTRMGCRRAARVTPRQAVAGFDAGIHTGPVSFIPVNTLCRVFH